MEEYKLRLPLAWFRNRSWPRTKMTQHSPQTADKSNREVSPLAPSSAPPLKRLIGGIRPEHDFERSQDPLFGPFAQVHHPPPRVLRLCHGHPAPIHWGPARPLEFRHLCWPRSPHRTLTRDIADTDTVRRLHTQVITIRHGNIPDADFGGVRRCTSTRRSSKCLAWLYPAAATSDTVILLTPFPPHHPIRAAAFSARYRRRH